MVSAALLLALATPAFAASEPIVGPIAQTSATAGTSTTLSATYADPDGVASCELLINGSSQGSMTLSGGANSTTGVASASYTFAASGTYTAQARCTDIHSNVGTGGLTTVSVAASGAAAVTGVSPASATAGVQTTLSATYDLNANVSNCHLLIDGADQGAMTLSSSTSSGTASATYTFATAGSHTAQVRCTDTNGAMSTGASTSMNVSTGTGLSIGSVTPTSATLNNSVTLSATYSGTTAVSSCGLFIDGNLASNMSLSSSGANGTASASYTFSATGAHTAQVRCTDANGTTSAGAITTLAVAASAGASVGSVAPSSLTLNAAATLSASYSLAANVSNCHLLVDGSDKGAMSLSGSSSTGTASMGWTFTSTGSHTAQVRCTDTNGAVTTGTLTNLSVSATGDTTAPSAPTALLLVTPSTDNTATFTWSASSDNVGVVRYEASIDGGAFVSVGNTTSTTTAALPNGAHTISIRAVDASGNVSSSTSIGFTINASGTGGTTIPASGFALELMNSDAVFVFGNHTRADFEARNSRGCEMSADAAAQARARTLGTITNATARANAEAFIACGTQTTLHLGAGERLGAINSFRAAFGKIPDTEEDWFDIIKIGNGRFPGKTSATAEANAHATFRLVYLRDANTSVTADNNAIVILAYGLRPLPRSMSAEAAAIATFTAVYHRLPASATDWDTVRAVAYSGATR
ncbi:MAG TPA: hypothetical protein VL426_02985 [Candidatus Binatia bacterium]|nr:hypothetical protein [Candidatus Binatia bacterium]